MNFHNSSNDISRFAYFVNDLRKSLRNDDHWRYHLNKNNLKGKLDTISKSFYANSFSTKNIKCHELRKNKIFTAESLYDKVTVNRTNEILKTYFGFSIFNRDEIVRQLIEIILTEKDATIIRTDIKQFFESVEFSNVIDNLIKTGFNNLATIGHLKSINNTLKQFNVNGLPRGLSISTTLSEFYLNDLDNFIRSIPSCIFYCRYVDDIVAVFSGSDQDHTRSISDNLPPGLSLNNKKTFRKNIDDNVFIEYLGYSILLSRTKLVKISDNKISKIKKRIALSIRRYSNDNIYNDFMDRIKFLASNTKMKLSGREKKLCTGIYYQYSHCTVDELKNQLKDLDRFYRSILLSTRYQYSIRARSKLSQTELNELLKISFLSGYENRITIFKERDDISRIKKAWRYE